MFAVRSTGPSALEMHKQLLPYLHWSWKSHSSQIKGWAFFPHRIGRIQAKLEICYIKEGRENNDLQRLSFKAERGVLRVVPPVGQHTEILKMFHDDIGHLACFH